MPTHTWEREFYGPRFFDDKILKYTPNPNIEGKQKIEKSTMTAEIKSSSHFVRSGFVARFVKKFPSLCYNAATPVRLPPLGFQTYSRSVDKLRSLLLRCPIMRINRIINAWRTTYMTQGKLRTRFFRILVVSVDESSIASNDTVNKDTPTFHP